MTPLGVGDVVVDAIAAGLALGAGDGLALAAADGEPSPQPVTYIVDTNSTRISSFLIKRNSFGTTFDVKGETPSGVT